MKYGRLLHKIKARLKRRGSIHRTRNENGLDKSHYYKEEFRNLGESK